MAHLLPGWSVPPPITVASAAWEHLPGVSLVVVRAAAIENHLPKPALVAALLERQAFLRASWQGGSAQDHPFLAPVQALMRDVDGGAADQPAAITSLITAALRDQPLEPSNPLVDLSRLVAMRFLLPVVGWDLEALDRAPALRFTTGSERFRAFANRFAKPVDAGELAFISGAWVIARHFVGQASENGKITDTTRRALLVSAIAPGRMANRASRVAETLATLIANHFDAVAETWILRP